MNSMTHYMGKSIYRVIKDTGRPAKAEHFLVAAVIAANQEKLTIDQLIRILHEANSFVPVVTDAKQILKELGSA